MAYVAFTRLEPKYWQSWVAYFVSWWVQKCPPVYVHTLLSPDGYNWVHFTTDGIQTFCESIDLSSGQLPVNMLKLDIDINDYLYSTITEYSNRKITVKEIWNRPSYNCVNFVLSCLGIPNDSKVYTSDELYYILSEVTRHA